MSDLLAKLMKLKEAKNDLDNFRKTYPLFYRDLMVLLRQYIDWYMIDNGFSIKLRSFFRVYLDQEESHNMNVPDNEYIKIKAQLDELFIKHLDCYSEFAETIREHVWSGRKGIGYSKITRLLFGEPVLSVFVSNKGFDSAYSASAIVASENLDDESIIDYLTSMFDRVINSMYDIKITEGYSDDAA